ncbi:LuxR C-terminal-related transcriptional regulator [Fangia hongkongensis]|uniref:LuxR C-terminal-related transcriptional regulator n=1 Tax=Fangia hongkongensis TaxID=270495 RepID=UPI00036425EB|nr:LuxR C-terminal-related transcriptional regulator [Fangia hongkongensis]
MSDKGGDVTQAGYNDYTNVEELSNLDQFLCEIGVYDLETGIAKLNSKELHYLRLLSTGSSYQEISSLLKLSLRSIYYYADTIKNKMNFTSRLELFKLSKILYG